MKSKFLYFVILLAGFMLAQFSVYPVYGQSTQNEQVKPQIEMYTCSMHPEVIQDLPGNCPKCGMKLVEKKDMMEENIDQAHDSACMKHESVKMIPDTTCMKHENMKMLPDSAMVRKDSMLENPKFMMHKEKDM